MKLTEENFQTAVKIGGLLLFVSTAVNLYLLLRNREVYRDASQIENVVQQQGPGLAMRQQLLEGVMREFASRASNDAGIAEIFKRHQPQTNSTETVQP